ncbi:hypothetical protein PF006_g23148 [Phytophthora fragariae]|uniref:Uncharacterized protein n=1 Tax=Phytophthora fragariae TaxID=53985 RepID=A0A6A3DXL3_9STRA|nr:hypothetical protein PF003_g19723 [Phytophthora fragariae]KAE8925083.1 hypothetical protein PF009_g24699 [Phytophthora fragariae]KAE9099389.1 hypothetical protein PF006_g23148 [Phytophthora fragariae]
MSFRGMSICAGMVASLYLLNAWTMRQSPVDFFTQNVGLECGEMLSRTWPALRRPSKKSSMVWT